MAYFRRNFIDGDEIMFHCLIRCMNTGEGAKERKNIDSFVRDLPLFANDGSKATR